MLQASVKRSVWHAANHTDEMRWSKKHNRKCLIFNFYFSDDALRRKNVAVNILFYFLGRARINRTAARTQLWEGIETCRFWKKTQNQYEQIMWPPFHLSVPIGETYFWYRSMKTTSDPFFWGSFHIFWSRKVTRGQLFLTPTNKKKSNLAINLKLWATIQPRTAKMDNMCTALT